MQAPTVQAWGNDMYSKRRKCDRDVAAVDMINVVRSELSESTSAMLLRDPHELSLLTASQLLTEGRKRSVFSERRL